MQAQESLVRFVPIISVVVIFARKELPHARITGVNLQSDDFVEIKRQDGMSHTNSGAVLDAFKTRVIIPYSAGCEKCID